MSLKIQPINGDESCEKWELVVTDEPKYICALETAPKRIEKKLNSGTWLVVAFSVWSVPVRHSVLAAVDCAKCHDGEFQLGLRPYNSQDELYPWWPSVRLPAVDVISTTASSESEKVKIDISSDPFSGPAWLVLKHGEVVYQGVGPRTEQELSEVMLKVLKEATIGGT